MKPRFGPLLPCLLLLLMAGCSNALRPFDAGGRSSAGEAAGPNYGSGPIPRVRGSSPNVKPAAMVPAVLLPQVAADPQKLKGLTGSEVVSLVGQPNFRRQEPPAEIWQFYGTGCVLDLFLYAKAGGLQVTHVELRSVVAGQTARPRCLARVFHPQHRS